MAEKQQAEKAKKHGGKKVPGGQMFLAGAKCHAG
jgi:hypothetical protein